MKCKLDFLRKNIKQIRLFLPLICLLYTSCEQKPKNGESELIKKINAVHKQISVQGNISEKEELTILSLCSLIARGDGFDNYHPNNRILFKDAQHAPVYYGCEELSVEETKKCFAKNISLFIKHEFNLSLSKTLVLSEPQQVAAFFVIDENGKLSGIKVRDTEIIIQAEIVRVLKKLPKMMKPAVQNGINVPVLCSILVTYGNEIAVKVVYIPDAPTKN